MQFLITGGTGFIGTELRTQLLREGHFITVVTRSPGKYEDESAQNQRFVSWEDDLASTMDGVDVVFNLAGENIFGQRWTDSVKKRIYNSRIQATEQIVEAIGRAENKPELIVSASAVGIYGDRGHEVLDESEPAGDGFLSRVCVDWEEAARRVEQHGVRLAIPRIGIVLETGGGALQQMLTPFQLFVGGPIGSGEQYFPWIHMIDLVQGLIYPVDQPDYQGVYNLNAPNPVTMNEFADALGEVLNRPSLFRVPEFVLNIALGEAAGPILDSLRTQPKKLQQSGFEFRFEFVREALGEIL